MLTLFNQKLHTAFPEEGNTLINEIRYYSTAVKAKEPRGHEFEILTHDEAAELAEKSKLQTEKKQDPKLRIVPNEGNRIKKVIDALKLISKIISSVNDMDDDEEIEPKLVEYNEKYNTKIKIRELEKELEDRYNGNVSLQVMMEYIGQQLDDLDHIRYHIAKHLYDAFDFKPLEEKVLVSANESDKKDRSIALINVFPSAEGKKTAVYHIKNGEEYRKDQINSAVGYNDKVVFRTEDLNPFLLAKKIVDHAYLSMLPFKSFQEGFKNSDDEDCSDNYALDILKAFSALAIKDYGIENDKQQNFMNILNQQADKIGMFYSDNDDDSDDNVHHSFLSSGEVEAAELYGVNVDFS
jgi:co-chaperonin GroES (HSP10)